MCEKNAFVVTGSWSVVSGCLTSCLLFVLWQAGLRLVMAGRASARKFSKSVVKTPKEIRRAQPAQGSSKAPVTLFTPSTLLTRSDGNDTKTHKNTQLNTYFLTFFPHGPASTPLRPRIAQTTNPPVHQSADHSSYANYTSYGKYLPRCRAQIHEHEPDGGRISDKVGGAAIPTIHPSGNSLRASNKS
jgi:hypothetical protein